MGSSVVVTLALYTMLGVRQLFSKGQVFFFFGSCIRVLGWSD